MGFPRVFSHKLCSFSYIYSVYHRYFSLQYKLFKELFFKCVPKLWLDERSWTTAAAVAASPFNPTRYGAMSAPPPDNGGGTVAHIAIIPLVSFVASFVGSVLMKVLNRGVGPKCAYFIGSVISVFACLWVAFWQSSASWELYAIASLFGLGSSVTMISSLCITADMIGQHADQSGFIYSAVTFADKLITGVVVIVIESL